MTIRRPYVTALLLGPGAGLNSVRYNIVLESTSYVAIMVPYKVLGSTVCVSNTVLGSTSRAINQYILVKNSFHRDSIVKLGLKIQYFIQQETM